MATKNKKDITTDLIANIFPNTTRQVNAVKTRVPISDLINSVSVNITIAQLQAEDDSAEASLVNIIDPGKNGVFGYDANDNTATDDNGGGCILTSTNKRYKRIVDKAIDARWYGKANYYFAVLSDATTAVKAFTRFVGLEVTILLNGNPTTYWFRDGILDAQLIVKVSETHSIDFTPGDGGALTPTDGATDYIDPALAGATILGFFASGRKVTVKISPAVSTGTDAYIQFDKPNNKLSWLNGGAYSTGTDYSILYK